MLENERPALKWSGVQSLLRRWQRTSCDSVIVTAEGRTKGELSLVEFKGSGNTEDSRPLFDVGLTETGIKGPVAREDGPLRRPEDGRVYTVVGAGAPEEPDESRL